MSQNLDRFASIEAKKKILQYCNDIMHEELAKNSLIIVATHNRADPRKFTIVADSVYDKELEGISLIFEHPEDFAKVFPQYSKPVPTVLAPNMEMDTKRGVAVPIHKDPYRISAVYSIPLPENQDENNANNVLNDDPQLTWAVQKIGATLLIDMGQDSEVGTLWIAWVGGKHRQFKFTVGVATEKQFGTKPGENRTFAVVDFLSDVYSSGKTDQLEPYKLVTDPESLTIARYIMIKVYGNTNDDWANISQVKVTKAVSIKSSEVPEKQVKKLNNSDDKVG